MSELGNGTAPLAIHTGMRETAALQVGFSNGDTLPNSALSGLAITDLPSADRICGVLHNPYFEVGRGSSEMFGSCGETRPFICTRSLSIPGGFLMA